jgi:hypothetical protein
VKGHFSRSIVARADGINVTSRSVRRVGTFVNVAIEDDNCGVVSAASAAVVHFVVTGDGVRVVVFQIFEELRSEAR